MNYNTKKEFRQSRTIKISKIRLEKLESGQPYQRGLTKSMVDHIEKHFNAQALGVIKVSARDGKYYVVDGQHRITALRYLFGGGYEVPCEIHEGLTYKDEAALYTKLNVNVKRLTPAEIFKGELESGEKEATTINKLVNAAGMKINISGGHSPGMTCIQKIRNTYKALGDKPFFDMMCLLASAWVMEQPKINADVMGGMTLFIKTYGTKIDTSKLVDRLCKTSPLEIQRNGKTDQSASGDVRFAKVIWQIYNKGLKESNRLPYKFAG